MATLPVTTKVSRPDKNSYNQVRAENGTTTPAGAPILIQISTNPPATIESGYAALWATSAGLQTSVDAGATTAPLGQTVARADYIATAVDTTLFIADRAYTVTKVRAVNTVAGTGGAASVDVKKCTGTQAPSAGTTMLTAAFDLTTAANTVTTPTLTTGAVLTLAAGDRVALDFTGTLTSLVGMIEVFMVPA